MEYTVRAWPSRADGTRRWSRRWHAGRCDAGAGTASGRHAHRCAARTITTRSTRMPAASSPMSRRPCSKACSRRTRSRNTSRFSRRKCRRSRTALIKVSPDGKRMSITYKLRPNVKWARRRAVHLGGREIHLGSGQGPEVHRREQGRNAGHRARSKRPIHSPRSCNTTPSRRSSRRRCSPSAFFRCISCRAKPQHRSVGNEPFGHGPVHDEGVQARRLRHRRAQSALLAARRGGRAAPLSRPDRLQDRCPIRTRYVTQLKAGEVRFRLHSALPAGPADRGDAGHGDLVNKLPVLAISGVQLPQP